MIRLEGIEKNYRMRFGVNRVLRGINLTIAKGEKVGIVARNGAGKSTLIRLIAGAERPTRGTIYRGMSASWPLALSGGFQKWLTGRDNLKFICRVYDVDYDRALDFVESFSELGKHFREPVYQYSSGMRARLAFAISMAIEFDCYLVDEVIAVGDYRFREKCERELHEVRRDRTIVLVSHQSSQIRKFCDIIYVLNEGILHRFDSFDEADVFYRSSQC